MDGIEKVGWKKMLAMISKVGAARPLYEHMSEDGGVADAWWWKEACLIRPPAPLPPPPSNKVYLSIDVCNEANHHYVEDSFSAGFEHTCVHCGGEWFWMTTLLYAAASNRKSSPTATEYAL